MTLADDSSAAQARNILTEKADWLSSEWTSCLTPRRAQNGNPISHSPATAAINGGGHEGVRNLLRPAFSAAISAEGPDLIADQISRRQEKHVKIGLRF